MADCFFLVNWKRTNNRYVGRDSRVNEPPLGDMEKLQTAAFEAIAPLVNTSPYVIVGYSVGAIFAREIRFCDVVLRCCCFLTNDISQRLLITGLPTPKLIAMFSPCDIEEFRATYSRVHDSRWMQFKNDALPVPVVV